MNDEPSLVIIDVLPADPFREAHLPTAENTSRSDGTYAAQAFITIDRTEWGVLYGSSRFFARLGDHVVNDHLKVFTL
jgi:hypothetical protein